MKIFPFLHGLLFVRSWITPAQAFCSSNLLIDDYSKYPLNSLGQYTNDDSTTANFKADSANKEVVFIANNASYFYTNLPCKTATTLGYNAITFSIKGPSGASFSLELQTSESCFMTTYTSYYYVVPNKMTGAPLTVSVPLSVFTGANLTAINSIIFKSFTHGTWGIGLTQLVCANVNSTSTGTAISKPQSPSVITSISSTSKIYTSPITILATSISQGSCTSLLIDDFSSQSRLTFLFYNAMLQPSSDDGTMKPVAGRVDTSSSVIVANNHVTLTPANTASYFYTNFDCLNVTDLYGGIGLAIAAPPETVITVELQTSMACTTDNPILIDITSTSLDWTFDGIERFYTIPFAKFPGLDTNHLISLLFSGFSQPVTLGPIAFYCGTTGAQYPFPTTVAVVEPSSTVPPTLGPSAFVIDTFGSTDSNNLGFYHGGDDPTTCNSDLSWYTQISGSCADFTPNDNGYLHIAFTGSNAFTISFQQHNPTCNEGFNPYPYTWDSVEASRYSNNAKTDIYVPISHFDIDRKFSIGFALKGFYTTASTIFSKIEIVRTVPDNFLIPSKLDTAPLKFACTRPNSFAFAIDDGDPQYAQQIITYLKAASIPVTFFTVGAALLDTSTNLTNVYAEMLTQGHQIAYHSFTHPPMEGLPSLASIDWEFASDMAAVQSQLGIQSTYFRPPFGTEGARVRQRLAALIPGAQFVEWSVDVQDYLWALSSTPEKQLANFQSDVDKGGNLVVCHFLYQTTVDYIPQFIDIAKKTGKTLMRVDQCMEDPNAPPL